MNFFGWDVVKKVLMVESLPVLFLRAGPGAGEKPRSLRTGSATLNVQLYIFFKLIIFNIS